MGMFLNFDYFTMHTLRVHWMGAFIVFFPLNRMLIILSKICNHYVINLIKQAVEICHGKHYSYLKRNISQGRVRLSTERHIITLYLCIVYNISANAGGRKIQYVLIDYWMKYCNIVFLNNHYVSIFRRRSQPCISRIKSSFNLCWRERL